MNVYWIPWLFGMAVPFGIKFANHMLNTEPGRFSFTVNTLRFMFADTKVAITTFISTTFELLVGAWYIDRLPAPYMPSVELPHHWVLALFIASIMEIVAPQAVKGILKFAEDKINRFRGPNEEQPEA